MQHTCTIETLNFHQWVHTAMYHSRSSRPSVMHSMRMPWVKCTRLTLYSSSHGGNHYCNISCIWSALVFYSIDQIILLTLSWAWGFPPRPYMSHIICISPIDGNHINTKTKIHHAPAPEAPPLRSKSYDVRRPYVELLPSHIRGQSVNPKIPHSALNGLHHPRTPSHDPHITPLDPHTLKIAQGWRKGLKTPKRSPK